MKTKLIFLGLTILLSVSCNRVLYYIAGLRTPQEESKASLKSYVSRFGLDTNLIYIPKDTASFYRLNKISSALSQYAFFNKNKELLMYKDTGKACSAPVYLYVKNLCEGNKQLYYRKYNTDLINDHIISITKSVDNEQQYDYYVYFFWYKYFGEKKFKDEIQYLVNSLPSQSCKIKIYLVNLDLQPGWKKDIPIKIQ
jgi:hypothetical protein